MSGNRPSFSGVALSTGRDSVVFADRAFSPMYRNRKGPLAFIRNGSILRHRRCVGGSPRWFMLLGALRLTATRLSARVRIPWGAQLDPHSFESEGLFCSTPSDDCLWLGHRWIWDSFRALDALLMPRRRVLAYASGSLHRIFACPKDVRRGTESRTNANAVSPRRPSTNRPTA